MFEKLYQLVKENICTETLKNASIPVELHESVVNEASGTIIDVLKSQIDKGRYNDLLTVFKVNHIENNVLVRTIASKYANRLNKYYGIQIENAKIMADKVILVIMMRFVSMSKEVNHKNENGVFTLFNKLSGNTINFETLFGKIPHTQLA
jgi:hypothetical protein